MSIKTGLHQTFSKKQWLLTSFILIGSVAYTAKHFWQTTQTVQELPALYLSQFDITEMIPATFSVNTRFSGSLKPWQQATLNAPISGEIYALFVKVGDSVYEGQVIGKLDTRDIDLRHKQAQSTLKARQLELQLAQQKFDQLEKLRKKDFASATDLNTARRQRDIAKTQVQTAEASVQQIEQQQNDAIIVAPFTGRVSERAVDPGQSVSAGTPLLKLVEVQTLELEALIAATDVPMINIGQQVTFRVSSYADREFTGVVRRISPLARQDNRRVPVFIEVANDDQQLLAGMFVQGHILHSDPIKGLSVPISALAATEYGWHIFLIKDGMLESQPVNVLAKDEVTARAIIESSNEMPLIAGSTVLTSPSSNQKIHGLSIHLTQVN